MATGDAVDLRVWKYLGVYAALRGICDPKRVSSE